MTWAVNKRMAKGREHGVQVLDCGHVEGGSRVDALPGGGDHGQTILISGLYRRDVSHVKGGGTNMGNPLRKEEEIKDGREKELSKERATYANRRDIPHNLVRQEDTKEERK